MCIFSSTPSSSDTWRIDSGSQMFTHLLVYTLLLASSFQNSISRSFSLIDPCHLDILYCTIRFKFPHCVYSSSRVVCDLYFSPTLIAHFYLAPTNCYFFCPISVAQWAYGILGPTDKREKKTPAFAGAASAGRPTRVRNSYYIKINFERFVKLSAACGV